MASCILCHTLLSVRNRFIVHVTRSAGSVSTSICRLQPAEPDNHDLQRELPVIVRVVGVSGDVHGVAVGSSEIVMSARDHSSSFKSKTSHFASCVACWDSRRCRHIRPQELFGLHCLDLWFGSGICVVAILERTHSNSCHYWVVAGFALRTRLCRSSMAVVTCNLRLHSDILLAVSWKYRLMEYR